MYEYCAACCLHFCECEGRKKKRKRHLLLFGREDGDEVARFLSFARSLQRALRKREKHRRKNTRYSKTYHKNGETLIVANAPPPKADTEGSDPGCADFTFSPSFVGVGSIFHSVSLSLSLSLSVSRAIEGRYSFVSIARIAGLLRVVSRRYAGVTFCRWWWWFLFME